jgi:hypothetical protein
VFSRRKRQPVARDDAAVVDRALCLSAVTMLGVIATAVQDGEMETDEAAKYLTESHRWLIREQLAGALSIRERALLAKQIPDWTPRESADAVRGTQALGALLWSLSVLDDMPPDDVAYASLTGLVPLLAATTEFRERASLRAQDDVASARDLASTVSGRRHALNWLCGDSPDWDSVRTGT